MPENEAPPHPAAPSNSTVATASFGLAAGIVVVYVINQFLVGFGLEVLPGEVASAIGTLVGAAVGLPFKGGRSQDVAKSPPSA